MFNKINDIDELLRKSKQSYQIFSDMDDVLVNFSGAFEKLGYGTPEEFKNSKRDQEFWNIIKYKTKHFWLDLDWMPDGKDLWNFIKMYNPTLLSTPAPAWADPNCANDKKKWVKRELEGVPLILSRNKADYAEENSILIDDMDKNIIPWKDQGGIAIKHTSAADTIKQLKKIII
jgi:hypothetical protein